MAEFCSSVFVITSGACDGYHPWSRGPILSSYVRCALVMAAYSMPCGVVMDVLVRCFPPSGYIRTEVAKSTTGVLCMYASFTAPGGTIGTRKPFTNPKMLTVSLVPPSASIGTCLQHVTATLDWASAGEMPHGGSKRHYEGTAE